jgi:uncharacterized LabA/DUF88 family protein
MDESSGTAGPRIGLYVDHDNLSISLAHQFGRAVRLDYSVLRRYVASRGRVVESVLFLSAPADPLAPVPFAHRARSAGFTRVVMDRRRFVAPGRQKSASDVSLAVCVGMAIGSAAIDRMVLVSGDGDFTPLVVTATAAGIEVEVITPTDAATSAQLELVASRVVPAARFGGLVKAG